MTRIIERVLLWALILAGAILRFFDLSTLDLVGDEGQFIHGISHAQPPFALWLMSGWMRIFGNTVPVARSFSAVLGILCIALAAAVTWELTQNKRSALLAAALVSILPNAIIFSRLIYLDIHLLCGLLLVLWLFIRCERHCSSGLLVGLFLASLATTFLKTQGFLLIGTLAAVRLRHVRLAFWRDPVFLVLTLSIIPLITYLLTHPAIVATTLAAQKSGVFLLSANRLLSLLQIWWKYAWVFLPLLFAGALMGWRRAGLAVFALAVVIFAFNFYLGAGHKYYTTYLALYAIPTAITLARFPRPWPSLLLIVLFPFTLLLTGPSSVFTNSYVSSIRPAYDYWTSHAPVINAVLAKERVSVVIVYPEPAHQHRWYLEPQVLSAYRMPPSSLHGVIVILRNKDPQNSFTSLPTLYEDSEVRIVRKP